MATLCRATHRPWPTRRWRSLCSSTPARAVCSPPLPVHTQCSRSARALHAQCRCPQHEATHKWRNTPAVRVAHRPSRTATMPAHAASPGPCRRSPGAAGLARATRLRSSARWGRICPLPRRRSPRRGRRSRRRHRGSRPRRPRRPSHSSPTRRARCSRANPKPHPHPHPHPRPKGAAHVLAKRAHVHASEATARGRPS